ncbi:thiamine phosphate synthase [Naumannella halotolerans]|uniref:Thiamine-phosphate synthase n=1 Tax=Naumannella halotolerans TaxID=993414 RepID=A0A4R7JB25_9ACTN|nr:thiamine phosphate synthase [Naumannella halotolerans]TDT33619.1 thiamine-phosphate pyrophosphorylase [Naumannella halotolerans]
MSVGQPVPGRARVPGRLELHLVTDTAQCGDRGVLETVRRAVAGGVSVLQIRDKTASAREFLDLVTRIADTVGDRVPVLVNDRVDIFCAAREQQAAVAGVHLGQDDLPAETARRILGAEPIIGLTASSRAQLAAADSLPGGTVDYLGVGVVRATATKPDHPPELGTDGFSRLAGATALPCVAIGGIRSEDLPGLRRGGAAGVAVVSAICASADPEGSARALADRWENG